MTQPEQLTDQPAASEGCSLPPLENPVAIEIPAPQTPEEAPEPHAAAPEPQHAGGEADQTHALGDGQPGEPRIIALMNQKGGVGKTTTAANVAAALAREGRRVLAIDLDPQAHLSLSLGVDPDTIETSVYHLLTDQNVSAIDVVHEVPAYRHGDARLAVIPAEVNLAGVESELADLVATGMAQTVLRNKLADLSKQFDFVLLDCPPSLGLLTINGLVLAREVIVPMQAHFLALQGLSKLLETVQMVGAGINPALKIAGVVLCMHEGNTILAGEVVSDLNNFMQSGRDQDVPWNRAVVFQPHIRRNIKLAESPSFGQPIFDYAPDSHGASDYAALAQSIAAHSPHAAPAA